MFGELSTLHVVGEVSRTQVKDWSLATGWNQERSARSQRSLASSLASSFEDGDLSAQSIRSSPLVQQALKLQDTASLLIRQNKTKQAYAILMEVVKLLGSKKCDEPARLLLSRVVDDIVQTLCGKAFRMPTEYDSVVDGVNALQLQLSSAQKLSVPYNGVPKQTLTRALNALTSINEINQRSESDGPTFTATKMCFRILQRLITGVGVRQQKGHPENLQEREINQVLNVFSNLGRMDMAHRIVALQERTRHAPPLSPVAYSILVKGYARQGDLVHVEEVIRHAKKNNIQPDVVLLNTILDAYNNCDAREKAQAIFDRMRGQIIVENTDTVFPGTSLPKPNNRSYNIMLKGMANVGAYDKAVALSEEVGELSNWDPVTTNTLVHAAVVAKEYDAAERILAKYTLDPNDIGSVGGPHPNVEAYTQLLDCYAKEGDMNRALAVMQTMRARGVQPNVVTYTCLIAGFGRSHQLDEAKKLVTFMKEKGIRPSTVTYNALISGLVEGASKCSEDTERKMDVVVDESLVLLRDMRSNRIRPNSVTASLIVDAMGQCEPPRQEAATLLVDMLESKNLVPKGDVRLYTAMIKTCGLASDVRMAAKYFRKLKSPDLVAVNAFIHACHRCDRLDLVKDTFNYFFIQKASDYKLKPDLITYSVLLESSLQKGDITALREAQSLYTTMKKKWMIRPDTGMIDRVLRAMIKLSRSKSLAKRDALFIAGVLRDAERLTWPDGQLERRKRAIGAILGDSLREVALYDKRMRSLLPTDEDDLLFQRKGWNKVDSGFRLWGQASAENGQLGRNTDKSDDEPVDEFLESHGWNNVDSGFRLL